MLLSAQVNEADQTLTLVLKLDRPTPSASGKTLVVASTRGNVTPGATVQGQPITVGVNAYIPAGTPR